MCFFCQAPISGGALSEQPERWLEPRLRTCGPGDRRLVVWHFGTPSFRQEQLKKGIPSGIYMVDGVGQPGVGYLARFAA